MCESDLIEATGGSSDVWFAIEEGVDSVPELEEAKESV